jgi:UDP-N-acetylmuramoyl-tripeptide--D-alanyl-D-alanine ligase
LFDSVPVPKQGAYAPDAAALAPLVWAALRPGDAVLVKGSHGSRLRDIVLHLERR